MRAFGRTLLALLPAATTLVVGLAIHTASAQNTDTVTASGVTVTVTDATDTPCEDDNPCWNPCTMGVNGEYPASDPRHYIPGPCRKDTPLPWGRVFSVSVVPDEVVKVACAPGEFFGTVAVTVIDPTTGDVRAEQDGHGCARQGDPLADFVDVLPTLYRQAAAQLDV